MYLLVVTDLLTDTQLISIPHYRIDPTELKELKDQPKDYPAKGFIQPSMSSCGSLLLFVRKKYGSLRIFIIANQITSPLRTSIPFLG